MKICLNNKNFCWKYFFSCICLSIQNVKTTMFESKQQSDNDVFYPFVWMSVAQKSLQTQRENKLSFCKLQIVILQTTDHHFANYRLSLCKLQIVISHTADFYFANYRFSFRFAPFRFANYSTLIQARNRTGPSTLPWGTPEVTIVQGEKCPRNETICFLPTIKWVSQFNKEISTNSISLQLRQETLMRNRVECLWYRTKVSYLIHYYLKFIKYRNIPGLRFTLKRMHASTVK